MKEGFVVISMRREKSIVTRNPALYKETIFYPDSFGEFCSIVADVSINGFNLKSEMDEDLVCRL